jgi:hypothetical protein
MLLRGDSAEAAKLSVTSRRVDVHDMLPAKTRYVIKQGNYKISSPLHLDLFERRRGI